MAKIISYKFLSGGQFLLDKLMSWNEENEEIAKKEAYNGEYTIEDDGRPEPEKQETTDDVLNALLGVTV